VTALYKVVHAHASAREKVALYKVALYKVRDRAFKFELEPMPVHAHACLVERTKRGSIH